MIFAGRADRFIWSFFMRPILPFAIEFLLLAPLILGLDRPGMEPLYLFLTPWILLVVGLLNMPLLGAVFRQFRMDIATRRNHALEHATIHYLWAAGLRRTAGRAAANGFRVSGGPSPEQIRRAFARVAELVERQEALPHVSRYCGSNRVTALALAMVMLILVAVTSMIWRPTLGMRVGLLIGVVAIFVAMRHAVGNWVQRRCFMATDFKRATIQDVRKMKPELPRERPPVYFVQTLVS